jgi:hypothetical protein
MKIVLRDEVLEEWVLKNCYEKNESVPVILRDVIRRKGKVVRAKTREKVQEMTGLKWEVLWEVEND